MTVGTQPEWTPASRLPTPPARSNRSGRAAAAVAIAVGMVLVVGVLAAATHTTGPVYPKEWDPRVADLAHYVEKARGLDYLHPVSVYFLDAKTYSRIARGDDQKPTAADRRQARKQVGELRALGVVDGNPDLLADSDTLADSGTLAFYDYHSKVVNVRGHEMTPGLRATLVHELTHVLQDQHFDVSRIVDSADSEASAAARSVVEGDAVDIEEGYVQDEMSAKDRKAYEAERTSSAEGANGSLDDVPDFLTTTYSAPYAFGPTFVQFFGSDSDGVTDNDKVDDLLRDPPPAMSHLFDPTDQLHDVKVADVTRPEADGKQFDRGTLGAISVFAMLADRIDAIASMDATDAWGGDRYVAYTTTGGSSDGTVCVRARVRPQPGTGTVLRDALADWQVAMPAEAHAKVGTDGDDITIESCDPGPIDTGVGERFSKAMNYPVVRLQLAQSVLGEHTTRAKAICVGDKAARMFTPEELSTDELTPELEQKVTQSVATATRSC